MSEIIKETTKTNFGEKTTYTNPKVSNALAFDNLCARRVFPTARAEDSYIEKCAFFENAEKHITAITQELKHPEIVERQIRADAQHYVEQSFVDTEGVVGLKSAKKDICPIALFHLMVRRNMGTSCGVSSCPYGGLKRTDDRVEKISKLNDFFDLSVFIAKKR